MTKEPGWLPECDMCGNSHEVLKSLKRTMGYTLTEGETIDEHCIPCPMCQRAMQTARNMVEEIEKHMHFDYCPEAYCVDNDFWQQLRQQVLLPESEEG